jgi:hypothetical protein
MTTTRLSRVDREAMTRAIDLARAESEQRRAQIDGMLVREPWEEVGEFAAYCCQDRVLRLKPWQVPPCWLRTDAAVQVALLTPLPDHRGCRLPAALVQELIEHGFSRFEPDPLRALAKVEGKATTKHEPAA